MTMLSTATLYRLLPLPFVFALLFAPLQGASGTAYACSCVSQTVVERVEGSELVFVGKIVRLEGAWPVFAVQRYYKGTGSAVVTVRDPLGGGASCSYFDQGDVVNDERDHLVFAHGYESRYSTSLCAGNLSSDSPDYDAYLAEVASITGEGDESTPWVIILPLAFAIPLAVLVIPALIRRRGGL